MVQTIQEGENTIVYIVFKEDITPVEAQEVIDKSIPLIRQAGKKVYTITELNISQPDTKILDLLQDFTKKNSEFVQAGAIYGLKGILKSVLNAVLAITGRSLKLCKDFDEAKEYVFSVK